MEWNSLRLIYGLKIKSNSEVGNCMWQDWLSLAFIKYTISILFFLIFIMVLGLHWWFQNQSGNIALYLSWFDSWTVGEILFPSSSKCFLTLLKKKKKIHYYFSVIIETTLLLFKVIINHMITSIAMLYCCKWVGSTQYFPFICAWLHA